VAIPPKVQSAVVVAIEPGIALAGVGTQQFCREKQRPLRYFAILVKGKQLIPLPVTVVVSLPATIGSSSRTSPASQESSLELQYLLY